MNRAKRKRAYRWEKRIDELERLANRWDLLQQIKRSAPGADLSLFESSLFKAVRCEVRHREDYSSERVGLSYIYELMTKYDHQFFQEEDMTLLWVQSPNSIDEETLDKICALVRNPVVVRQLNAPKMERTELTIIQLTFPKPCRQK